MNSGRVTSYLRISAALAAASAMLFAWAAIAPVLPAEKSLVPQNDSRWRSTGVPAIADTTPDELIVRAVERDPFAGHKPAAPATPPTPSPIVEEQALKVLGTVVDSLGANMAICQLGAAPAVVLHVGQRLGAYELRRVEKTSAIFLTPEGGRVERQVPRAGS